MDFASGTIFLAGLATFASPCVLPMIPIYLSVLVGGSLGEETATGAGRMRLLLNGLMFILGFTLVFMALGLTATAVGTFLVEYRLTFQQLGGLLVFVFGLKFLGWLKIDLLEREKRFQLGTSQGMSPWSAFVMGLTFAFGWTPCIGPVLGAILTYTAVSTDSLLGGAWNLFLYAAGIGLPLLIMAVFAQSGMKALNRLKRFIPKIEKATGIVLLAMGVLMVTDSTSLLTFGIGEGSADGISDGVVSEAQATPSQKRTVLAESTEACDNEVACDLAPSEAVFDPNEPVASLHEEGDGPTVVYFFKPHCKACLKMTPIVQSMKHTCSSKGLNIRKIDLGESENRGLAARFGVRGTPTMLFLASDGSEVARIVGVTEFDNVHRNISVLMGEKCEDFTPL